MRSVPAKRPYTQRLRAESSAATRLRIIEAARDVLTAQPLRSLRLSEVAESARVVRSTIYAVFGSRLGLLRAVVEDARERGGWDRMRDAYREPDAVVAVTRNLEQRARMIAHGHRVALAITALAVVDPDAAAVAAEVDAMRLRGLRDLVRRLDEQGRLRPDLDREQALDILWSLSSWGTYDQLATGRGLDPDAVAARLVDIAVHTLFAAPGANHDHRQDHRRTTDDRRSARHR